MLSCVMDVHEWCDIATIDIPGMFMQANMDEEVHMQLQRKMAKLIVQLDPTLYIQYTVCENGKLVLYVVQLKALYGTLHATLLFMQKLMTTLGEPWVQGQPIQCLHYEQVDCCVSVHHHVAYG